MEQQRRFNIVYSLIVAIGILSFVSINGQKKPIVIQDQGSFAVGGTVKGQKA
jgi:hypothetical protein